MNFLSEKLFCGRYSFFVGVLKGDCWTPRQCEGLNNKQKMNRAGIHRTPTSSTASLSCSPQGDDTENLQQTEALLVYLTWFTVVNIHYVLVGSHLFWGFGWWSPDKEPDRWSDRTATLSTVSCRVGEEERPVEQQTAEVCELTEPEGRQVLVPSGPAR